MRPRPPRSCKRPMVRPIRLTPPCLIAPQDLAAHDTRSAQPQMRSVARVRDRPDLRTRSAKASIRSSASFAPLRSRSKLSELLGLHERQEILTLFAVIRRLAWNDRPELLAQDCGVSSCPKLVAIEVVLAPGSAISRSAPSSLPQSMSLRRQCSVEKPAEVTERHPGEAKRLVGSRPLRASGIGTRESASRGLTRCIDTCPASPRDRASAIG